MINNNLGIRFPKLDSDVTSPTCAACQLKARTAMESEASAQCGYLEQVVTTRRRVKRGAMLYNGGDKFNALFYVRTGFF